MGNLGVAGNFGRRQRRHKPVSKRHDGCGECGKPCEQDLLVALGERNDECSIGRNIGDSVGSYSAALSVSQVRTAIFFSRGGCFGERLNRGSSRARVALEALKIGPDIRCVLISNVSVFLEGFIDDFFELGRKVGIQANWRDGGAFEDGIEDEC